MIKQINTFIKWQLSLSDKPVPRFQLFNKSPGIPGEVGKTFKCLK